MLSGAISSAKIADVINDHKTIFVGTENFGSSVSQTFFMRLNDKVINAYFIRNIDYLLPSHNLAAFKKAYTMRFNQSPTILSAYTYDAMKIILGAQGRYKKIDANSIPFVNYTGVTGVQVKDNKFSPSHNRVILTVSDDGYKNAE